MINTSVTIENACNTDIKYNILPETIMRSHGFTDHDIVTWYMCRLLHGEVGKMGQVTFNISINKKTSNGKIDILDEDFLQPFDYQKSIIEGKGNSVLIEIHNKVQDIMKELKAMGVIENYNENDYI